MATQDEVDKLRTRIQALEMQQERAATKEQVTQLNESIQRLTKELQDQIHLVMVMLGKAKSGPAPEGFPK